MPYSDIQKKKEHHKKWYATKKDDPEFKEKEKQYHIGKNLKTNYGLTTEQYDELLEQQNHSCAICKRDKEQFTRRLAVDHDHKTGEIFGLLCTFCNRYLIGKVRDADLFQAAVNYLRQGTGLFVPDDKIKGRKRRRAKKKS